MDVKWQSNLGVRIQPYEPPREKVGALLAHYAYAPYGRPAGIALGPDYAVTYAYDEYGRFTTVAVSNGPTFTYTYLPGTSLLVGYTNTLGLSVAYEYEPHRDVKTLVSNAWGTNVLSTFAYTYDALGRRTVRIDDGTVTNLFGYNLRSELTSAEMGTNTYSYAYDPIGQLTNASATLPDGTPWSGYQFSYTYDATGNPIEQNKNGLVYSNSFNNLNQNVESIPGGSLTVLGAANYPGGTATVNNVQAQMAPDGTFAAFGVPFALGTNTLASVFTDPYGRTTNSETTVNVSPKTFGYDLNGNMTNDSRFVYAWDCENRLVSVRDAQTGTLVQSNRYDALWRRREKIEYAPDGTAVTNRYIYKDWLVLAIPDASGALLETYTHGADLSGQIGGSAGGIGGILASSQAGDAACYHYDFNGNDLGLTSLAQITLASTIYTPFGEILIRSGIFTPRHQFSMKELDAYNGLNYYGFRFYDPRLARWPTRDPLDELSFQKSLEIHGLKPVYLNAWLSMKEDKPILSVNVDESWQGKRERLFQICEKTILRKMRWTAMRFFCILGPTWLCSTIPSRSMTILGCTRLRNVRRLTMTALQAAVVWPERANVAFAIAVAWWCIQGASLRQMKF